MAAKIAPNSSHVANTDGLCAGRICVRSGLYEADKAIESRITAGRLLLCERSRKRAREQLPVHRTRRRVS